MKPVAWVRKQLRLLLFFVAIVAGPPLHAKAPADPTIDQSLDGSYRLADGHVLTGGLPVDGGRHPSGFWSERSRGWMARNYATSPEEDIARLDIPVLWFLGDRDENVPFVETREAPVAAFARAPAGEKQVVILEGAPHLFIVPGAGGDAMIASGSFSGMKHWLEANRMTGTSCGKGDRRLPLA